MSLQTSLQDGLKPFLLKQRRLQRLSLLFSITTFPAWDSPHLRVRQWLCFCLSNSTGSQQNPPGRISFACSMTSMVLRESRGSTIKRLLRKLMHETQCSSTLLPLAIRSHITQNVTNHLVHLRLFMEDLSSRQSLPQKPLSHPVCFIHWANCLFH